VCNRRTEIMTEAKFWRGAAMRRVMLALGCLLLAAPAEAGGGRFLAGLLARGAVVTAVHSGSNAASGTKSYAPDVLTVAQLAQCITKAGKLDGDSERLEADRAKADLSATAIDASKAGIDRQKAVIDSRSRSSVNALNALIDRHNSLLEDAKIRQAAFNSDVGSHNAALDAYNAECTKKYYADDLAAAQKLAGLN
jgi:hypothetical protein